MQHHLMKNKKKLAEIVILFSLIILGIGVLIGYNTAKLQTGSRAQITDYDNLFSPLTSTPTPENENGPSQPTDNQTSQTPPTTYSSLEEWRKDNLPPEIVSCLVTNAPDAGDESDNYSCIIDKSQPYTLNRNGTKITVYRDPQDNQLRTEEEIMMLENPDYYNWIKSGTFKKTHQNYDLLRFPNFYWRQTHCPPGIITCFIPFYPTPPYNPQDQLYMRPSVLKPGESQELFTINDLTVFDEGKIYWNWVDGAIWPQYPPQE